MNPAPPTVRCAIYTRKSSEEGLEQSFNSLHAQREACEAYVLSQRHEGWQAIQNEYDDGGFSGGNMARPGLKRLMADIGQGLVDTIVVYKVDRLTRSLADFAKIVESLDDKGVSFVSVTQQFNTTSSMGRLTLNVLLSFAQFEREVTGERIRDKIAASKKKGMWMGGPVPLGYDTVDTALVINEAEASIVRMIFGRYLELGSVRLLQEELEATGVRSKRWSGTTGKARGGNVLSRGTIYHLLNNVTYIGITLHKGIEHPGRHGPIIDAETWKAVRALLDHNKVTRYRTKNTPSGRMLQGLLRDANGQIYTPTHSRKGGKQYFYYTLKTKGLSRPPNAIVRLSATEIESCVIESLHPFLSDNLRIAERFPELGIQDLRRVTITNSENATLLREGSAKEKREIVRLFVEAVVVQSGSINIQLRRSTLLANLDHIMSSDPSAANPIMLHEPFVVVRRGSESRIVLESSPARETKTVSSLVRVVVQARTWADWIIAGEVRSLKELTERSKTARRHTSRILRLAVLAPDIAESILRGEQCANLTVEQLTESLPLDWNMQRELSGACGSPSKTYPPIANGQACRLQTNACALTR